MSSLGMKKNGVKNVAYIGFSDAWGDLVHYHSLEENGRARRHRSRSPMSVMRAPIPA